MTLCKKYIKSAKKTLDGVKYTQYNIYWDFIRNIAITKRLCYTLKHREEHGLFLYTQNAYKAVSLSCGGTAFLFPSIQTERNDSNVKSKHLKAK